jgi:His/Glu/Gln/Arg/opine family amino acid ABC transporter permease subunit
MSYQFRWNVIPNNLDFILSGLSQTLFICAWTLVLSVLGGLAIAMMDTSRHRALRWLGLGFGEIIRNTPILVQILWVYYVLPMAFNISIDALPAAIIALSVYSSAFMAEAYRAGLQGVPAGQAEAARVLGLNRWHTFSRIVLPQAVRLTLPAIAANFVQLIKYSSLASVISVSEITRRGMELSASAFRPLEIFTFIAIMYFCICWPLAMAIRIWERRLSRQ